YPQLNRFRFERVDDLGQFLEPAFYSVKVLQHYYLRDPSRVDVGNQDIVGAFAFYCYSVYMPHLYSSRQPLLQRAEGARPLAACLRAVQLVRQQPRLRLGGLNSWSAK